MIRYIWIVSIIFLLAQCIHKTSEQLTEEGFDRDGAKAIRFYTRAIAKDKNNAKAYWRRAFEFYKKKQYSKSLRDLSQAISIDSSYNSGYLFGDRGETKEAMGDLVGAVADYTVALRFCIINETEPSTPKENFFFYRGRTHLKLGDIASASSDTDSALHYWSEFPRARYLKGRIEVIKGNYQSAFGYYSKAPKPDMAHDKEYIDDVFYYGLLKFKTGDSTYCDYWKAAANNHYPKAIEYFSKYCQVK